MPAFKANSRPMLALDYSARHAEAALLIAEHGTLTLERYDEAFPAGKAHALYSGTKSFWGVLAMAAQEDGLLTLDEPVAATIAEWQQEAWKRDVTLRQLLNLTSGFGFGGLGSAVPLYAKALATPLRNPPGTTFTYGGIPLQVFGAVLARKLAGESQTPHDYLRRRILGPLGLEVASWRKLADGTQPLPTGAFLTAHAWLKYGLFLRGGGQLDGVQIVPHEAIEDCRQGSAVNPRYGLGFWLYRSRGGSEVFHASGAGGQAMYVIPQRDAVIVRFGGSGSYKHEAFLNRWLE